MSQSGLSLAEILVVVSIVAVVVALSIPSFSRALDNARLKSAAQQLSGIYEDARIGAAQNNTSYEVLVTSPNTGSAVACIDLNGDGQCSASEPQTVFPGQVILNNNGVPQRLGINILGFDPQNTEKSHMVNASDALTPGLAWNSRGVPCERNDPNTACSGMNGWIQYLQLPRAGGDVLYAAVTVSPTGRIKIWTYIPAGNGNGSWF
jgi:Tfp pilus assembly protein FimT